MRILNVQQMTEVDRLSTEIYGVPSLMLMENAGMSLHQALAETFGDNLHHLRCAILCGKGNNGGDGLVLARQLAQRGVQRRVALLGRREDVSGDAAVNLEIYLRSGESVEEIASEQQWDSFESELSGFDIVVDALLGTGLSKPLRGLYARAVEAINRSRAFVLAVDIPTGMFSDSLQSGPLSVRADLTVTFTAPKIAHVFNPDQEALGRLIVAPIGSPPALLDRPDHFCRLMTPSELAHAIPERPLDTHKGAMGKVAVIGGSRGKSGAAVLAASAALHSGSGLVTILTPSGVQGQTAAFLPDLMTEGLPETESGGLSRESLDPLLDLLETMDAAALGPGLGTHPETVQLVLELVSRSPVPLVLDADALNALATDPSTANRDDRPLVLTPHPGEFSRLTDVPVSDLLADRLRLAREFAQQRGLWLVLKGFRTLLAEPGGQVHVCPRGNPGMAVGGMGDALTGVLLSQIGTLAARGWEENDTLTSAAALAVYLHSAAGDLAAAELGPEFLTASALIDFLGDAVREIKEGNLPAPPSAGPTS